MRRAFALLMLVGLLAACGSSGTDTSKAEQKYIDAMMKSYDASAAKATLNRQEARCLSERFVATVGVKKIKAADLTPADIAKNENAFAAIGQKLTRTEAEHVADVFTDGECLNFTDVALKQIAAGSNQLKSVPEDDLRCLFDRLLAKPAFKTAMVEGILGSSSSDAAFDKAFGDEGTLVSVMIKCQINPATLSGNQPAS